jgi:hypothetical protein
LHGGNFTLICSQSSSASLQGSMPIGKLQAHPNNVLELAAASRTDRLVIVVLIPRIDATLLAKDLQEK